MSGSSFKANVSLSLCLVLLALSCSNSAHLERDEEGPKDKDQKRLEEKTFHKLSHDINVMQDDLSINHEKDPSFTNYKHRDVPLRGFHAKSHGCLKGRLVVLPLAKRLVGPKFDIDPKDTLFGIFMDEQKEYDILARFSNGLGFIQKDSSSDVRGLAIKVLGVEGERVPPIETDPYPEQHTQDFLMTNNPTQLASTAQDFMEFGKTQDSKLRSFIFLFWRSPRVPLRIWWRDVNSLVNEQYWSDAPIRLGKNKRTIKYTARPCKRDPLPSAGVRDRKDEEYLTKELRNYAPTNHICFEFLVQFQLDSIEQPMEDALTEWEEEDTPFIPVAQIQFPPQKLKETKGCEGLRFTPWHALAAHQPVGNMNRGRRLVYESSQRHRYASFTEPNEHSLDTDP